MMVSILGASIAAAMWRKYAMQQEPIPAELTPVQETAALSSGWIVTWKFFSSQAPERIVAIYSSRNRSDYVLRRVEQHYVDTRLSYSRRLEYAANREILSPIEKARFVNESNENGILCGINPSLYARRVTNLRVLRDVEGQEHILWEEGDDTPQRAIPLTGVVVPDA